MQTSKIEYSENTLISNENAPLFRDPKDQAFLEAASLLKKGDIYTYKELCEYFDEPKKAGNSKRAQLKEWSRFIELENIGRKYLICDIYDVPLPKNSRYPANAVYIKYIETMLLSLLASTEGNKIHVSFQYLYRTFGMVNNNYINMKKLDDDKRLEKLQKVHENITSFEMKNFFERCSLKLHKIVDTALKSLQKRNLIIYNELYEYYIWEPEDIYNPRSNKILKKYEADDDEIEYILKVKRAALLKYGCETEGQIYLRGKGFHYNKEIRKRINEERGWTGLYKVYKINYCQETSIQALQEDQLKLEQYGLNTKIIEYLNNQARRNYEKTKDLPEYEFRYPDQYVEIQELLSYHLLNIDDSKQQPRLMVEMDERKEYTKNHDWDEGLDIFDIN